MPKNVYKMPFKGAALDDTARDVLGVVNETKSILQSFQWAWWEAVAFFRGDQWSAWDHTAGRLRQRPVVPWRIRVVDNQVLPQIMRQQAMLIERRPVFSAMPRTDNEDDVLAALGFDALMMWHWDRLNCTDKLSEALLWALICGTGFWRVDWDATAGDGVLIPKGVGSDMAGAPDAPTLEEGLEQEAEDEDEFFVPGLPEEPEEVEVRTGDVQIRVVSPFQMFVDPSASRLDDARWVAQESFVHVDLLRDRMGSAAKDIAPDVTASEYYNYEQSLRFDRGTSSMLSEDTRDQVRVIEYWERPSKKHPGGRVVTIANERTLDERDNPYGGSFPYVAFRGIKVPGRFWGDGYVKHLRPLQTMHNRAVSRYHEIMNLMGNPKWVVDKGSGIKETSINDRPGEVITKTPGMEVIAVSPPPAPTIHPNVMSLALNGMQTISGINDPLVGQNPPNVRSASALYGLQEAAMRSFVPLALNTESSLRDSGRLVLNLIKRFYTEDRAFRVLGDAGRAEVHHLKAADVERVADVTVVHGSMFPKSKAAQQDRALQLLQVAPMLFMKEDGSFDTDRLMSMLEMPAVDQRLSSARQDRAQAFAEHVDVEEGRPLVAQPWEDHQLHMRLHIARLQNRTWTEEHPEAAQALAAHLADHENLLQQKAAQAAGGMPQVPTEGMGPPSGPMGGGGPTRPPAGGQPSPGGPGGGPFAPSPFGGGG